MRTNSAVAITFYAAVIWITAAQTTESESQDDETTEESQGDAIVYTMCDNFGGNYAKIPGYTCCKNQTLENPFNELDDSTYGGCDKELKAVDEDDIPTATWREYLCMLNITGATSNDTKTFKNYMEFMTSNYAEPLKSEIKSESVGKCRDYEAEKDEVKKIEMFHKCLYHTERKLCHVPYKSSEEIGVHRGHPGHCKPEEDFPYFGERCCKGRPLPTTIPKIFSEMGEFGADLANCSKSFIERQKELDPEIKKWHEQYDNHHNFNISGKRANACGYACQNMRSDYKSKEDLKIEYKELKEKMFTLFSKVARNELLKIMDKYMIQKNFQMPDNSTVSAFDAIKLMSEKDELTHLQLFCTLHEFILSFLERVALEEYCYDEKAAKTFFQTPLLYG